MTQLIEDYALIGNNATAALVGRNGSIDWLSFPRFDSPACFAALLGSERNGRWKIAPNAEHPQVKRRYRDRTLVLETEFTTPEGKALLVDCMDRHGAQQHVARLLPASPDASPCTWIWSCDLNMERSCPGSPGSKTVACRQSPDPTGSRFLPPSPSMARTCAPAPHSNSRPARKSPSSSPGITPTPPFPNSQTPLRRSKTSPAPGSSGPRSTSPTAPMQMRCCVPLSPSRRSPIAIPAASSPLPPPLCPKRSAASAIGITATAGSVTPL